MYYVTILETAVRRLTKIVQESLNWEQQFYSQCVRATKGKYDSLHPGPLRGITLTCNEYNARAYKHTKTNKYTKKTYIHTYIHTQPCTQHYQAWKFYSKHRNNKTKESNFQNSMVTFDSLYVPILCWTLSRTNVHLIGYIWLFGNESTSSTSYTWSFQGQDQRYFTGFPFYDQQRQLFNVI
jgi:hypothetical protein